MSVLALWPRGAAAAAPSEWGYWWKLQSGVGPVVDPPPFVPDRGLWVASDPSGPQAVSALRFVASPGERAKTIVLTVADSEGSGAGVRACRAADAWEPVEAGAWDARPDAACGRSSLGRPSADGTTWSFDVSSLTGDGALDIALMPGAGTFSLAFEEPGSRAIATEPVASASQPPPAPEPIIEPARPSASVPVLPGPQALAAPPAGESAEALSADVPAYPAPSVSRVANEASGRSGRPLALLALALVAVAWIWRDRAAERATAGHALAQPIALERDASVLRRAEQALAGETD